MRPRTRPRRRSSASRRTPFRPEEVPAHIDVALFGTPEGEGPSPEAIGYAIFSNTDVELPAGEPGEVTMTCTFDVDVDFVTLASHMHMLGVSSEVRFAGGARDGEVIHTSGAWDEGGMTVFDPPLRVAAGDALEITCRYADNDSATPIVFGPSANDEMCQVEGYILGEDTVLGGTAPTIGIERCMVIRLDDSNKQLYRQIIDVFTPSAD